MPDKTKRIELRVTQSEKEKITKLAEICGLSQSEYLRQRALGFAPKTVPSDAFLLFNKQLYRLCDEIADKVSSEIENCLLEVAEEIQRQLLLPERSTAEQIRQEVDAWQQQAFGPSRDG